MGEDDIILRATDDAGVSRKVGIFSRNAKKRDLPTPPQTPEPKRHTPKEAAQKIARVVVESTVRESEDSANTHAQELITKAAEKMERLAPKKRMTLGQLFESLKRKNG